MKDINETLQKMKTDIMIRKVVSLVNKDNKPLIEKNPIPKPIIKPNKEEEPITDAQKNKNDLFEKMIYANLSWSDEFKKRFENKVKEDPEFLTKACNQFKPKQILRCNALKMMVSAKDFDMDIDMPARAFRASISNRAEKQ